jgi:hypothetical protein
MKIPFLPHSFLGNQTIYLEFFLKKSIRERKRERERERERGFYLSGHGLDFGLVILVTFPSMDWISNSSSWWLEKDELSEMVSDRAKLSVSRWSRNLDRERERERERERDGERSTVSVSVRL